MLSKIVALISFSPFPSQADVILLAEKDSSILSWLDFHTLSVLPSLSYSTIDQNGFRARSGTVFPGVATKLLPHGTLRSERERLNYGVSQKKGCGGRGRRSNQDRFRNIRRGWRSANFRPVKASRRVASRRIRLRYVRVQRRVTNWSDATVCRVFDRLFCRYLVTYLFSRIRETFCYSTACY